MEVGKSLGKAGVVGGVGLLFLMWVRPSLMHLGSMPMGEAIGVSGVTVAGVLVMCSVSLLLIAAVDVPFQLWNHNKQLRMTRREVQDELKETEGRPEVRSRVRAMQQELARQRMLEQVPDADVVVTNPTHFSVALKYDEVHMKAPQVVASGMDLVATRIRSIAEEHPGAHLRSAPAGPGAVLEHQARPADSAAALHGRGPGSDLHLPPADRRRRT